MRRITIGQIGSDFLDDERLFSPLGVRSAGPVEHAVCFPNSKVAYANRHS